MISTPPETQASSSDGQGFLQRSWQKLIQTPTDLKHGLAYYLEQGIDRTGIFDLPTLMDMLQHNRFSGLIGIYRCALIQVIAKNVLASPERQQDFQNLLRDYPNYRLETITFDTMLGLTPSVPYAPTVEGAVTPQNAPTAEGTVTPQVVYVPEIPFVEQLFDFFSEINFRTGFQEAHFQNQPILVVRIKRIYNFMLKLEKALNKIEEERLAVAVFYPELQELFTDLFSLDIDLLPWFLSQVPQLKAVFQSIVSLSGLAEDDDVYLEIKKYLSAERFAHLGGQLGFWNGLLLSQSHAEYRNIATIQGISRNVYAAMDGLSESCQKLSEKLATPAEEMSVDASPYAQRLSRLQQSTTSFLGEKHKVSSLSHQLFNPKFLEKLSGYVDDISGHVKDILPLSAAGDVLNQIKTVGLSGFSALGKIQQVIALVKMIIKLVAEYPSHLQTLQGSYNDVLILLLIHLKYDVLMQGIAYVDLFQNNLFLEPTSAEGKTSLSSVVEIHFQHIYQSLILYLSPICDFSDNKHLEVLFDAGFTQKRQELAINNLSHLHGAKLEIDTLDTHYQSFARQIAALSPAAKKYFSMNWSRCPYVLPVGEELKLLQQNFVVIYPLLQKVNAPFAENLRIALQAKEGTASLQDVPSLSELGHHIGQIKAQNEFQKLVLNQFLRHLATSNQQGLFFLECPSDEVIDYHKLFKLVKCNYAIIKIGEHYYFLNQFKTRLYPLSADITPNLASICQRFMDKPWVAFRFSEENCLQVLDLFGRDKVKYLDREDDFVLGLPSTAFVNEIGDISPAAVLRQGRFGEEERAFKKNMITLLQSMKLIEESYPRLNRAQLVITSLPKAQKDRFISQLRKILSSEEIYQLASQGYSFLNILSALSTKLEDAKVGLSVDVNFSDIGSTDYDVLIDAIRFGQFIKLFDENYHQLSAQEIIELYDAYQSKIEHFNYHLQFCREWFEELGKYSPRRSLAELSSAQFNRLWYLFNLAKPILQMAKHVDDWPAFELKLLKKDEIIANLISLAETIYARIQPFFDELNQTQQEVVLVYRNKVSAAHLDKLRAIKPDFRADKLLRHENYSTYIGDLMAKMRYLVNSHLSIELKSELILSDDKTAYPVDASLNSVYKLPKQVADIMWAYNCLFHLRELSRGFEAATGTQGLYHLPSQIDLISKYFTFQNLFFFYRPSSLKSFCEPIEGQSRILKSQWLIKQSLNDFFHEAGELLAHYDLAEPDLDESEMSRIEQLNMRSQHSRNRIINGVFLTPHLLDRYQRGHAEPLPLEELRQLHEKHLKIGERADAAWHPSWYFSIFELPNLGRCILDGIYLIDHILRSTKRLSYERFRLIRQEIFKIYAQIEALEIDCHVKQGLFLHKAESFFEAFCQKTLQSLRVPIHEYVPLMSKMPMFDYRKQFLERELLALTQDEQIFKNAKKQLDRFMAWCHEDETERASAFIGIIGLLEEYRHIRLDDPDLSPGLYRSNCDQLKLINEHDKYFRDLYLELRPYCVEQGLLGDAPEGFVFPIHFFNFIETLAAFIEGKLATIQLSKRIHENRIMSLSIKMGIISDLPLGIQDVNTHEIEMMTKEKTRLICGHYEYFKERCITLFAKSFVDFPVLHQQYKDALSLHFNQAFEKDLYHAALQLPQNIEEHLNTTIKRHCETFDQKARVKFEKRHLVLQKIHAFKHYLEKLNELGRASLTEDTQGILQKIALLNILEQKISAENIDFEKLALEIKANYSNLTQMRQACGWIDKLFQYALALLECVGMIRSHRHCFFYGIYDASKQNMPYEKIKPKISEKEAFTAPEQFARELEKKFEPEKCVASFLF